MKQSNYITVLKYSIITVLTNNPPLSRSKHNYQPVETREKSARDNPPTLRPSLPCRYIIILGYRHRPCRAGTTVNTTMQPSEPYRLGLLVSWN